ncbi:hypothetical protein [Clostridium tagluense]|uniref:hypothetical protein n=1 Tax=Clostridium tagluense TaxID=360422 RepID=UPI001CF16268|nr:hypothetical protein [Clostridium tagluense]MCB2300829.1 hypothetical protein [Clostridium tagluense]
MSNWKDIKIDGITRIEKCVAEFRISQLGIIPGTFFRVEISEGTNGFFSGITNIGLKSSVDESVDFASGYGDTIEKALEFTINNFMEMINERNDITPDSFMWIEDYFNLS